MIKINFEHSFVSQEEINQIAPFIDVAHNMLHDGTGAGNDFIGWTDYASRLLDEDLKKVKDAAKRIKDNSEVLVVVGIGGSYLGSKAVIDAVGHTFYNMKEDGTKILYAGQNISGRYLTHLLEVIKNKDVSLCVISKSGTTTEPALAFRVLKEMVEEKYGKDEAAKRIYAITDKARGALRTLADKEGYESFIIPDNVGGRYSVITPVGLLPIAVSGLDVDEFVRGFIDGEEQYAVKDIAFNPCYQYVALRNILNRRNKDTEILVNYEPSLSFISEWWKQLYGESEGKNGKGLFPASVNFTTDLHSMGQYVQDGKRNIFETVLLVKDTKVDMNIKANADDLDGLNYLEGKTINYVNQKAFEGTLLAHINGNVPNIILEMDELSEYNIGNLMFFFMKGCGVSGYLLGVNPFDQPGVEEYKKNMFALLGKPGYEGLL